MHSSHFSTASAALVIVLTTGCERPPAEVPLTQPDRPASQASIAPSTLNGWLGQWDGVEGTYLQLLAKPDGTYEVVIKNLDAERRFQGVGGTDRIDFERDGTQETIRATDGAGTGMKWLAGKTRCLVVRTGEGYCRE